MSVTSIAVPTMSQAAQKLAHHPGPQAFEAEQNLDSLPAAGGAGLGEAGTVGTDSANGSSNPFDHLGSSLQAWLNQNQGQDGSADQNAALPAGGLAIFGQG